MQVRVQDELAELTPGRDRVLPTQEDPAAQAASKAIGGAWGQHGIVGRQRFWTPLRVCLALTLVVLALSWVQKSPCQDGNWTGFKQYTHLCYSDVVPLFGAEKLDQGAVPYRDHPVEYPVLTGGFMFVAAKFAAFYDSHAGGFLPVMPPVQSYFTATAIMLAFCALIVTWCVSRLGRARIWDAAFIGLSPVLLVHAFTNWDLFAVALAALGLVAWQRNRPVVAGIFIGLGTAAKLYPVLFFIPLFFLCWRARKLRSFSGALAGGVVTWLAINVPVAIAYWDSWKQFFTLNQTRVADPDSLWNVGQFLVGGSLDGPLAPNEAPSLLNAFSLLALALVVVGIGILVLKAPHRPRLPQLLFLMVAGFLLVNKVWSPQYSLWLVPLAVLARPSWRAILAWQATEAFLWFPRLYWYLGTANKGIDQQWFLLAVVIRDIAVLVLCALIIRDIIRPERDIVRQYGEVDDPAGGVLDGAPDSGGYPRNLDSRPAHASV